MGWREKENAKLVDKRVLVVGAGGIGCELLKNLVLTGFKDIHVIDLDTIDVSNLNRQFLFRREHVGKSKAEVATAAVRNLLPGVKITFDHGSIFEEKFALTFYQQFMFVMNALDNKAARTHVNRMCLAGRIPLIESGSAGYLGQVTAIIREKTECFECVPKPAPKTFPGCTIRNTPSEHIHCTVWSKHVFNQLFGEVDIDDDVSPDMNDEENKPKEVEENHTNGVCAHLANGHANEASEEENMDQSGSPADSEPENTRAWAEKIDYCAEKLFMKLFHDDIHYLLKMENLWKERRAPIPLTLIDLEDLGCSSSSDKVSVTDDIEKVWSGSRCGQIFVDSVDSLRERKKALPEGEILSFDKDDEDAMRFVAACANIRAQIFGIPMKTFFDIKSMAGNIIPAIATTNAIVAGMMVVEALKIVDGSMDKLRNVFINRNPNPRGKILMDEMPSKPNPSCFICSDKRECFIRVNIKEMTVKGLQDKVLKGALNMVAPDVMYPAFGSIVISSDEDDDSSALDDKKLCELSISDGALLDCDDFMQNLQLKLIIQASDKLKGDEFEVVQDSGPPAETADDASRKRAPEMIPDNEVDVKRTRVE